LVDNVLVTGTNSPGFSPATVYYGSASYAANSKLIAEIGGTIAGSFDQQNFTGTADVNGTLDIELINNFAPYVGNSFTLINATGGIHGTFSATTLPMLPQFWYWQLSYGANDLKATIATNRAWYNSISQYDVNRDAHVVPLDALLVINFINAFGSIVVPQTANYVPPFYDTNGDNNVSPIDALGVINIGNAGLGGEGEARGTVDNGPETVASDQVPVVSELLTLLANDIAEHSQRSRRILCNSR